MLKVFKVILTAMTFCLLCAYGSTLPGVVPGLLVFPMVFSAIATGLGVFDIATSGVDGL